MIPKGITGILYVEETEFVVLRCTRDYLTDQRLDLVEIQHHTENRLV